MVSGGGIGTDFVGRDGEDEVVDMGTARVEGLFGERGPVAERRVGEGGGRVEEVAFDTVGERAVLPRGGPLWP